MTTEAVIDNGACRLRFSAEADSAEMLGWLIRFFAPYFELSQSGAPADVSIHICAFDAEEANLRRLATGPVDFRRSSCPEYNLSGFGGYDEDGCIVAFDPASRTGYRIDRQSRRVEFYASPGNPGSAIHLHDFTRYLALLICEARNHVLLHASAVTIGGKLILVLGSKGAGKTTTMLRLVIEKGGAYFSGDKVLAKIESGRLVLRAWPDIPYIGVGSLLQFPGTAEALGFPLTDDAESPLPPALKQLVDPLRFREVIPHSTISKSHELAAIFLPDVKAAPGAKWLPASARRWEDLVEIIEWPHEFLTAQWHGLYLDEARRGVPDRGRSVLAALAEAPWLALNGPVALPLLPSELEVSSLGGANAAS